MNPSSSTKRKSHTKKMAAPLQMPLIAPFIPSGKTSSVAQRWQKLVKSFHYCLRAYGITDATRKKNMLLHPIGSETQEIFDTLADTGGTFDTALTTLNNHFSVQKNIPYEQSKFHQAHQEQGESIEQFVTRLRKLSSFCEHNHQDEQIRDQVLVACLSMELRKKLLTEKELTLNKTIEIAKTMESANSHIKDLEQWNQSSDKAKHEHINHLQARGRGNHHS